MAENIRCRAKNPSACWKHGSGITTTVKGAKIALQSAKEEFARAKPSDIEQYTEHRKAIERFEQRIAYLSGTYCSGFTVQKANDDYASDLYKEKVLEAFKDSDLSKFDQALIASNPYDMQAAMRKASPVRAYYPEHSDEELLELAQGNEVSTPFEDAQRENARKVQETALAEGFKVEAFPVNGGMDFYFYKPASEEPNGYDAWKTLYKNNSETLNRITKEVEVLDKEQYDAYNKAIRKQSIGQKLKKRFGKPEMINGWVGF